ncbi:hypothetical protein EJB05_18867, partial [Eragrostis curvula]
MDASRRKKWVAWAAALAIFVVLMLVTPAIPQDEDYHDFADQRTLFLGIPNTLNVISNIPFLFVGITGLVLCHYNDYFRLRYMDTRICFSQGELWSWTLFFAGVTAVAFGSSYYHLFPNDATLVWDRLPVRRVVGVGMAMSATSSNLIVYLIKKYNVKSIDAAQISNIVRGCMQLAPVAGAVVSDAFFGCYPVVAAGVAISLLLFCVHACISSEPCSHLCCSRSPPRSRRCVRRRAPPRHHHAKRRMPSNQRSSTRRWCLLAVGNGGTRYNTATMGADQFDGGGRDAFFSWYFVFLYASYMAGDTAVVYLQDSVSWPLGFGVCAATTAAGLVALVAGSRHYRRPVPKGSPFTGLARVLVAATRKAAVTLDDSVSLGTLQYYHGSSSRDTASGTPTETQGHAPSERFGFLNRAAMIAPGDTNPDQDGSVARPWRVCTVQQVEDLKSVIRVLPLWSSGILVSMTVNAQVSLTVLQALTMDRRVLGPHHFAVPAASITVTVLAAFVLFAALFDRLAAAPRCRQIRLVTPLRRVGLGHALNVASMAVAALVERRRIRVARGVVAGNGGSAVVVVPMSAAWLVAQLALTGAEEAMHLPGNTALFYREFPPALRSTATAMPPLFIAAGSYLSTAFVDVVRRATPWLPDDLNRSRLDCVYWTLAFVAAVNFGYFLVCATMYQYKDVDDLDEASQISDDNNTPPPQPKPPPSLRSRHFFDGSSSRPCAPPPRDSPPPPRAPPTPRSRPSSRSVGSSAAAAVAGGGGAGQYIAMVRGFSDSFLDSMFLQRFVPYAPSLMPKPVRRATDLVRRAGSSRISSSWAEPWSAGPCSRRTARLSSNWYQKIYFSAILVACGVPVSVRDANKTGAAQEAINGIKRASKAMTEQEARQILGLSEKSTWEEIVQKYDTMFERNAKNGSFYLQSKVHRAKECLEATYQKPDVPN